MPKIAVSLICKNNEATIGRLLESVAKHVDAIYATDTGSTDRTIQILNEYGAHVSQHKWKKNFSEARNFAFAQIPKEYDYILWVDTDDVVSGAEHLRKIAAEMDAQELTATYFTYNYKIDEQGHVLIEHARERLVKNGMYEWKARIHEVLVPKGKQNAVYSNLVSIDHYPIQENEETGMLRNLELLELQYKDEGEHKDPRTEYYLARQYFDLDRLEEAFVLFQDYIEHSGWDEERAMAWNYLGEIAKQKDDYATAEDCYLMAIKERADFPTWYVNLAQVYEMQNKHDLALHWVRLSSAVPQKEKTAMVMSPKDDIAKTLETIFFANFHLGKFDEAWAAAHKLAKLYPDNEVFYERLKGITDLRTWKAMTAASLEIAQKIEEEDIGKLEAYLNSLPAPVAQNATMQEYKNRVLPPKEWPKKSIAYFCGKTFERWTPETLKTGLGGSETAVIMLAAEWAKLGYEVTVYGYPDKEGMYDGVNYLFYWRCNFADTFDTFISWRNESVFKLPLKARKKLLDLHDVVNANDYPPEVLEKIDSIMVKSKYHTSFLPDVPKEKFSIISNGVEPIETTVERDPFLISYASSYDRGLQYLLQMWPKIKEEVPGAKLEIAYGWDMFDKVMAGNPERQAWKKKMVDLMSQDGITHLGRISKAELLELHARSSILAYYCTFEEINCITVLEAQAMGSLPVTTDFAALKETNRVGFKVPGDPYDKETRDLYTGVLKEWLRFAEDTKRQKAKDIMAEEYLWPVIAKQWEEKAFYPLLTLNDGN